MSSTILVIGGAGYIGSHTSLALLENGYDVVVFDDLSTGHRDFVSAQFIEGSILDPAALQRAFRMHSFDAVVHFAAKAYVGESVYQPRKYYQNNIVGTLHVLDAMNEAGVKNLIFSSTCATYGIPDTLPIREDTPQNPINPYGRTKLAIEWAIRDYARAYDLHYTVLRYFNVAGADPALRVGERHNPETHLIPLVLQAASGKKEEISVFGNDYNTPDGTCVRDYLHVSDLAAAHVASARQLIESGVQTEYNVGIGTGYSVNEVIRSVETVTGKRVPVEYVARRPGDPPILVSDATRINEQVGWQPIFRDIDEIVETAWQWYKKEDS